MFFLLQILCGVPLNYVAEELRKGFVVLFDSSLCNALIGEEAGTVLDSGINRSVLKLIVLVMCHSDSCLLATL